MIKCIYFKYLKQDKPSRDYHIHRSAGWTDKKIRTFRKHVRSQNICVRLRLQFYSNCIERGFLNKYVSTELVDLARYNQSKDLEPFLDALKIPYWFPENFNGNGHHRTKEEIYKEYEENTTKPALKYSNVETKKFKTWRNKIQRNVIENKELYL